MILLESAVKTLDPRFLTDSISAKVSRLVFSPLVSTDNEELAPVNDLAEEIIPDMTMQKDGEPLRYMVKLRKGVKFHDGGELTAEDVAYTYNSILDPVLGSPYRFDYSKKFSRVYPADGGETVIFELKMPLATFKNDLALGIVPARLAATGGKFNENYVGTGGFRFAGSKGERFIFLERFDGFYGKRSSFKYVCFIVVTDEGARIMSLLSGTADIVLNGITPAVVEGLTGREDLRMISEPSILFTYLAFNLTMPLFEDKRVRQALMHAIPREKIIENKFRGGAKIATGLLPEFHWAYSRAKSYEFDPIKAEKLLDDAGFKRGADGVRFRVKLKISNNRLRRAVAQDIAHYLGMIGVHVDVISFELSTFLSDIRKGNYEMTVLQLVDPVEPDIFHWMFYSLNSPMKKLKDGVTSYGAADRRFFNPGVEVALYSGGICGEWAASALMEGAKRLAAYTRGIEEITGKSNRTYYFNPVVDCLLDIGRVKSDAIERKKIYGMVQEILAEELPVLPLWHEDNIAVVNKRVKGFKLTPNARFAGIIGIELDNP